MLTTRWKHFLQPKKQQHAYIHFPRQNILFCCGNIFSKPPPSNSYVHFPRHFQFKADICQFIPEKISATASNWEFKRCNPGFLKPIYTSKKTGGYLKKDISRACLIFSSNMWGVDHYTVIYRGIRPGLDLVVPCCLFYHLAVSIHDQPSERCALLTNSKALYEKYG